MTPITWLPSARSPGAGSAPEPGPVSSSGPMILLAPFGGLALLRETSEILLDIVTGLKRISSHITELVLPNLEEA
jgi:hypothetical protein